MVTACCSVFGLSLLLETTLLEVRGDGALLADGPVPWSTVWRDAELVRFGADLPPVQVVRSQCREGVVALAKTVPGLQPGMPVEILGRSRLCSEPVWVRP